MKKWFPLFSVLVAVFLIPLQIWSQNVTVTVGTGTATTNTSPINSYYRHSWTECIYQASDIAEDGYIYRVGWECSDASGFLMNTMEIYMGTTPNTTHANSDSWLPMNQLTLVYSGVNVNIPNSTGWLYFDLDDAFEYSSNENLVIVVAKTAPSWTSSLRFYATPSNNAVLYRRSDNYTEYANHPGMEYGTLSSDLANVRLFFTSVNCPSARNITISDITTESALATWTGDPSNTSWLVGWGLTETAAQTNVITVQDTFVVLDNLSSESQYYFSIQSVCDTIANGHWKTTNFRTPCAGNYVSGGCFDLTNLSNPGITCMYGDFYYPYRYTGIAPNRHTVVTQLQYDPNTNYTLPTIPDCRDYSIRLGNDNTGAEAESISLDYVVDTMQADLIILQYAVVMEDPGHSPEDQPRFTMEILNNANQLIDAECGYDDFVASSGLGWSSYGGVIWNEWTTVGMDISAYHGQNVKVRMTTYDCEQGGHFGYAYFLLDCGSRRMKSDFCGLDTVRTFMAPAGFRYEWYWESNPDSIISVDRSVTFFEEHNERIFCKVTSLSKDSCYFRIYGSFEPRYPIAGFSVTPDYCTRTCVFHNESVVSADGITPNSYVEPCDNALWDFGDGTVSQQYNPTHVYDNPGTYQVRLISGLHNFSCTDTAFYTIAIPSFSHQIDTTSCSAVQINNVPYSVSGDYVQHLNSVSGCDSVINLHVTIHESYSSEETVTACETYTWQNEEYTQSGNYTRSLQTIHGCDSLLTLHLTIAHNATTDIYDTACESYVWNGETYFESGDYVQHFQTSLGCDSMVTLHLIVAHNTSTEFSAIACETYEWNGVSYSSSGDYEQYFYTTLGCDSTVTLHLVVGHPSTIYIVDTICSGDNYYRYNFHIPASETSGVEEYETEQVATNIYGCDSTVNLRLTVFDTSLVIIAQSNNFCADLYEMLTVESGFPNYLWSTGDVTDAITVYDIGTYSVTATYERCSAKASYTIPPCEIVIYTPNVISTSNHDGLNDYFSIITEHYSIIGEFEVLIFNRWGEMVYYSTDMYFKWYGEYRGQIHNEATYNYIIRYTDMTGKSHKIIGSLTVL